MKFTMRVLLLRMKTVTYKELKFFLIYPPIYIKGEEEPSRIVKFPDSSDYLNVSNIIKIFRKIIIN